MQGFVFNSPPGWPDAPDGWTPPEGWKPDPTWPSPPSDWVFWVAVVKTFTTPAGLDQPPTVAEPAALPVAPPVEATPIAVAPPPSPPATPEPATTVRRARDQQLETQIVELRAALATAQAEVARAKETDAADVVDLDDDRVLQEVGIYQYHHPLENAAAYRERLDQLEDKIKTLVKTREAILASDMFTFNNSLARGRKMTSDFSKLMLRAYNAEADNCVRSLRAANVVTAKKRLEASVTSIAKLGSMMEMRVNPDYHALRIDELDLTADFLMKQQQEREEARDERERLREQRKVEQELAAERERLDKERAHLVNTLETLKQNGDEDGAAAMAEKLATLDDAIAHNDMRAANIRLGHVYVISNEGAFGPNMVKIGLTRRLEPMDRVRELGDASVPFPFAVHALYFSEDAVTLEKELHQAFAAMRVNHVNERREFFFATPQQVRSVLSEKVGNLLEFTEHPEATQYMQSRKYWPTDR